VLAAYRTVAEGAIHSLHSYFVRAGTHEEPIRYGEEAPRQTDGPPGRQDLAQMT